MKTSNKKMISQLREISTKATFLLMRATHGNTKRVGALPVNEYNAIVEKRQARLMAKVPLKPTMYQILRQMIQDVKQEGITSYTKVIVEGNTGLYLASPTYAHADYNKFRIFDKNEKTLKVAALYNSIILKN